jgi:ABC-2 type transport system ATP-binding protein
MADAEVVIRTEGLTKDYGDGRGVFDLDLEVRRGEVLGYLGPNGAGKSTTIRMLLDMVRPTSGRAEVLGVDPRHGDPAVRGRIAYVPGELSLWRGWTARHVIDYLGALRGGLDRTRVEALAERFALDLDRVVGELSKGNKQNVGLVSAFAARAELLILDEPTSGLDPLLQAEFVKLVRESIADGASVLLSSHVLGEVEHAADRVGIIRRGRMAAVLGMAELAAQASQTLEVTFEHDAPTAWPAPAGVEVLLVDGPVGRYRVDGSMDAFVKALAGHAVAGLRGHDADLEQVFLRYYADDRDRDGDRA